jgi:type I restriction enzyme S subunit
MSTATLHIEKKKISFPKLRFKGFIEEWKQKRLGEIAKITTGSTPNTLIEEYYNGEKLFVSPADIQENRYVYKTKTTLTESGFSKGRKVAKGSVLFVCIGSTIGKIAQATEECLTNQQINALYATKDYDNNFIYELLEKNGAKIKLLAGVQAVPQINKTDFSNFKYFLPSIQEQQKIASFLSAVDEKIQQLSRKKELLEQYKKGIMQQLFSGKLRFKDENGKDYSEWKDRKFGDVLNLQLREILKPHDNYLAIGIRSHVKGTFQKPDSDPSKIAMDKLFVVKENDLIVNITFAWEGAIAIAKKEDDGGLVSHRFPTYTFNSRYLLREYFAQVIIDKRLRMILDLISPGGAGRNRVLSKKEFLKIDWSFPCIEEQEKIANFLSSIDSKIESTSQQINQMQSFKKGLLQQLFV